MASNLLHLYKGTNTGLENAILEEIDPDGNVSVFDLTGVTSITVQILDSDNSVAASFTGTVISAAAGTFYARPQSDSLDELTSGQKYNYQIKFVSADYPEGRIFGLDGSGRRLQCIVI